MRILFLMIGLATLLPVCAAQTKDELLHAQHFAPARAVEQTQDDWHIIGGEDFSDLWVMPPEGYAAQYFTGKRNGAMQGGKDKEGNAAVRNGNDVSKYASTSVPRAQEADPHVLLKKARATLATYKKASADIPENVGEIFRDELAALKDNLNNAFVGTMVLLRRASPSFVEEVRDTYANNMHKAGGDANKGYEILGLHPKWNAHTPWTDIRASIDYQLTLSDVTQKRKWELRQLSYFFSSDDSFEEYRAFLEGPHALQKLRITDAAKVNDLTLVMDKLQKTLMKVLDAQAEMDVH